MRILLACDGSPHAEAAADLLERLPLPEDARFRLLTVIEDGAFERVARELLARVEEQLRPLGRPIESLVRSGDPAHEIIAAAADADLVALGARGLGRFERLLLGSVSSKVASWSPSSVLVARPSSDAATPLRSVLGFDGSDSAWIAVKQLGALPLGDQLEVTLVGVLTSVRFYGMDLVERASQQYQQKKTRLAEQLDEAATSLRASARVVGTELREGFDISSELLATATERRAELVVLGHEPHGDGRLKRFVGSTGSRILHHASASVWIARQSQSGPAPSSAT